MKRQTDIKVYTLKDSTTTGKLRKIRVTEEFSNSRIEEHAPNFVKTNVDGTSEEFFKYLQSNPFLYNPRKAQYAVSSIEEFYIDVKKDKVPFGAVVRSKDLDRFKKRKIITKALKNWKNDFKNQKNEVFNKQNDQLVVVDAITSARFSITSYIILIFLLILLSLISFKNGEMWTIFSTKSFFEKMVAGIDLSYSHKWVKIVATLSLYQIFLTLFYGFFHNAVIKDFIRTNIGTNSVYKRSCKILEKNFKKKFAITRKYYLKQNWKNPLSIAPLGIDKTSTGEVDLEDIKAIIDAFIKKSASLKRKKYLLQALQFLTFFLSCGGGLTVVGYTLYSIIIKFI